MNGYQAPPNPQGAHRVYTLEELLSVDDCEDRWIVPQMIPKRGHTIFYGEGSTFKSTLVFDLAIAVASGGLFLQRYRVDTHGPVLLVSTESSIEENAARVKMLLRARELPSPELDLVRRGRPLIAKNSTVKLHFCQDAFFLDDPQEQNEFERIVAETRPVLIIVDPLDSFLSSGDENSPTETRPFRLFFNRIRNRYGTSQIILHHATKASKDKQQSLRGTGAWQAWADAVMCAKRARRTVGDLYVDTVQVDAQKQRNGYVDTVLRAIPEYDESLQITTFSELDGQTTPGQMLYGKARQEIVKALKVQAQTRDQLAAYLGNMPAEAIDSALDFLYEAGLVANDRGFSRLTGKVCCTDVTVRLLREQRLAELGPEALGVGYTQTEGQSA